MALMDLESYVGLTEDVDGLYGKLKLKAAALCHEWNKLNGPASMRGDRFV